MRIAETERAATDADIDAVERQWGRPFPPYYREHLKRFNGGRPEPDMLVYKPSRSAAKRTDVAWFFSVGGHPDEDLGDAIRTFRGRVPDGMLPIARDSGGGLVLLATVGELAGRVFYWDRRGEAEEGDPPTMGNVHPVADSFDAFLAGICAQ